MARLAPRFPMLTGLGLWLFALTGQHRLGRLRSGESRFRHPRFRPDYRCRPEETVGHFA